MATTTPPADELRRLMTEQLISSGALRSGPWRDAFSSVPRHVFVPEFTVRARGGKHGYDQDDPAWLAAVYGDVSLLTQFDVGGTATSSSTQPSLMARMLEALDVKDGDAVLEIGAGTGYNAALLCHRLGSDRVVSLDIDPDLVNAARDRLRGAGYNPTLMAGDGMEGCLGHAPYARLLATCGVGRIPDSWREQVRPGGVIVANVGCGIVRLRVDANHDARGPFLPDLATFMAARPTPDTVGTTARGLTKTFLSRTGNTREIAPPTRLDTEMPQFFAALVHPTVIDFTLTGDDNQHMLCLYESRTSSWARITSLDVQMAHLEHGGPRDLWAEREPLLTHWAENGRPASDRYGLSATSEEHRLWFETPDGHSWRLSE
ncbi:methyltransferase domain-containing protein [Streptomyces sp. NPDC006923]|uniref:methyltransferase domain-containing protein n=1 Tax=Streptomyces sp. NPDC006923 TaxID=3155355 RepID=UPI0033E0D20E